MESLFPALQLLISGCYKPFRTDIGRERGRALIYVNYSWSSKILNSLKVPDEAQIKPFQANFRKSTDRKC